MLAWGGLCGASCLGRACLGCLVWGGLFGYLVWMVLTPATPVRPSLPLQVGTGQFGLVRVVRHRPSNQVYALKIMFKVSCVHRRV